MEEGLIRGWGLSQVSADTLKRADQVTPVSAVQNLYNILERDCEDDIFHTAWNGGLVLYRFLRLPAVCFPVRLPSILNLKRWTM